jgi:hypothetical protein
MSTEIAAKAIMHANAAETKTITKPLWECVASDIFKKAQFISYRMVVAAVSVK